MPPREAKGRYLTREYMADAAFHREHDAIAREFYMMLALFTDDAGWLEWDPDHLTFTIYRYEQAREEVFAYGVRELTRSGRLKVYKCGHAFMPKVAKRPRSGEHEYRVRDAHHARCTRPKSTPGGLRSSRPPDLTLPKPYVDSNHSNVEVTNPAGAREARRGRRGGPSPIGEEVGELKRRVGWEPPAG